MKTFSDAHKKLSSWSFNGQFGKEFSTAFNFQMWCFGCDIRRSSGNLLVEYGFTKARCSGKYTGSSRYSKNIDSNNALHLWGFAMLIGNQDEMLLMKRHQRLPVYSNKVQTACLIDQGLPLNPKILPKFRTLDHESERISAQNFFRLWITTLKDYENFVESRTSKKYRQECLKLEPQQKGKRPSSMLEIWQDLENICGECPI